MPDFDCTYTPLWPEAELTGMVSPDPARRVATHVDGPTLFEREFGFERGIASVDRAPTCIGRSNPTSAAAGPGRLRRTVVSLALCGIAAMMLAACGGSSASTTTTNAAAGTSTSPVTSPTPTSTVPGTPVGSGGATGTPTTSAVDAQLAPGDEVKTSKSTPKAFVNALGKQAILVVMYQPGEASSDVMRSEVKAAIRGRHDVLVLQYTPAQYEQSGDLADQLDLFDIPSIAIIDRSGKLQNAKTIYWPANLIALALDKAVKAPRAQHSSASATAAPSGIGAMATDTAQGTAVTTTTAPADTVGVAPAAAASSAAASS